MAVARPGLVSASRGMPGPTRGNPSSSASSPDAQRPPSRGGGPLTCCPLGSENFEQARAAHAAADAHGDDRVLGAAALAFLQDVAGEPRAGHAEGVADGDGAAVDVVLLRVDAQLVAAVEALAGEGLVQLPQVDVVHLQAMPLQQARDGEDRPDAYLVGLAAG